MKYGIIFTPTNEYVSFYDDDNNKYILFTEDINKVKQALNDILIGDAGYDGPFDDFSIKTKDIDTDGSEYISNDDSYFVSADVID